MSSIIYKFINKIDTNYISIKSSHCLDEAIIIIIFPYKLNKVKLNRSKNKIYIQFSDIKMYIKLFYSDRIKSYNWDIIFNHSLNTLWKLRIGPNRDIRTNINQGTPVIHCDLGNNPIIVTNYCIIRDKKPLIVKYSNCKYLRIKLDFYHYLLHLNFLSYVNRFNYNESRHISGNGIIYYK